MHTTCSPIHWAMFVSLSPQCDSSNLSGPGRRRIGINRSIFLQLHLLKFHVVLAFHTGLVCPAVCSKLNMMFKWIVDKTEVILLVMLTYFRFCNGRNLQMLLVVNTVLGSCEYGKCVWCTFCSPVYCLYLYAPLGTFNQNSPLAQSLCFRSACDDPINITFSDRTFTWFCWDSSPTLLWTLSPRWSPRDLPPQRRRRRVVRLL